MKLTFNKELALIIILVGLACGCSGSDGGSNESDKRTVNGKSVDSAGTGDVAPGQARRAAARGQAGP